MTLTTGNLFPSHSCIGWPESSPHWDSNPGPQIESQTTYQLDFPLFDTKIFATLIILCIWACILHFYVTVTTNYKQWKIIAKLRTCGNSCCNRCQAPYKWLLLLLLFIILNIFFTYHWYYVLHWILALFSF